MKTKPLPTCTLKGKDKLQFVNGGSYDHTSAGTIVDFCKVAPSLKREQFENYQNIG